jgi:DNA-binding PucR family transcriptional regulator
MAGRSREDGALVAKTATMIVSRLEDRLPQMTDSIHQSVVTRITELLADAQLRKLMTDAVEGNLDTFFSAVRHHIPIDRVEPPTAALEYARRLAQRGVSANALVRSYRLGHEALLNIVLDEIRAAKLEPQLSLDVFQQITTNSFRYIDWISHQVLLTYQAEYDRLLENRNSMRALRVREVLDRTDIDLDAMSSAIRYPLRRIHLALVVWCTGAGTGDELTTMERFVAELAESLGATELPLFIGADPVTGWAWIPLPAASNVLARLRPFARARADAPWIAAGDALPGVEGFRRSHRQALQACAVATAAGSKAAGVIAAGDAGLSLAALLGDNLEAARGWVGEVLGPLASDTDNDERLRETLRAFLLTGSSFKAAADELHLHSNSVKYRVQRAVDRRGKPIADDRLDVEVALNLCHWFDAAMLS